MLTSPVPLEPRDIPHGRGACTWCDTVHYLTPDPDSESMYRPRVLPVHDQGGRRCPGGLLAPVPWLTATRLPQWDAMAPEDRAVAAGFAYRRAQVGSYSVAASRAPARYRGDPRLASLNQKTACRHAAAVVDALTCPGHKRSARKQSAWQWVLLAVGADQACDLLALAGIDTPQAVTR